MRTTTKSILVLLGAAIFAFLISSSVPQLSGVPHFNASLEKDHQSKVKHLPYHKGMITIKVKKGIVLQAPQSGNITFSIASLDSKVDQYQISGLEKRFTHKPIPENSNLPDLSRIYKLSFPESMDIHKMVKDLNADPNIEYAELIPVLRAADEPNDELLADLQHLPQIYAESAWDIHHGEDGEEVVVAIVDNGVYWKHDDLSDNIWQNLGEDLDGDGHTMEYIGSEWVFDPDDINGVDDDGNGYEDDFIGWDFKSNDNDPDHNYNEEHGTHCMGIAAGVTNNSEGIASISWNVKSMPLQVANQQGTFTWAYDAITYAAENGAHIISNSWGGAIYSQAFEEVIDYATGLGSIVVAAAHNYNNEIPIYPASYPKAISVASVAVTDVKANYSNYGAMIDISAPGGDNAVDGGILSCIPSGYATKSGTSMATPMVAGLMALIKSYNPDLSQDEIITQVIGTADDINDVNPEYAHKLGSGRINSFRALTETGVTLPEELRMKLMNYSIVDENGNDILEVGETAIVNVKIFNYAMYECTEEFTLSLLSDDPQISILSGDYTCAIPPDAEIEINDFFEFQVSADATCHIGEIKLSFEGEIPVTVGQELIIRPLIAPDGALIIDGNDLKTDMSGWYIEEIANALGVTTLYSTHMPESSIHGFDAIFLSFGNYGSNYIPFEDDLATAVYAFLANGGNVYIEGGDALGFDQAGNTGLYTALGLQSVGDGFGSNAPITHLEGQEGTLTEDMLFNGSTQSNNIWIDIFNPLEDDDLAFEEYTVGHVGIQHEGSFGQKSFCFSYSLANLVDEDEISNRVELVINLLDFFDLEIQSGYLIPEFGSDTLYGSPPLEVNFNDKSISDPDHPVNSWSWDLDGDGVTDSQEESPTWTYEEKGHFSVTLIVSNGITTDTIVKSAYIDTKAVPFGTWTLAESPYEIHHRISVPHGQTLIIEPGVEVNFQGFYKFEVKGQLLAEGTESDSITFTTDDTETGWHSMEISANSFSNDTSKLSYCIIEHGKSTGGGEILENTGGGISIMDADVVLSNSTIRNNLVSGTGYYGAIGGGIAVMETSAIIKDCKIINNEAETAAGGISLVLSNSIVEGCEISNNLVSENTTAPRQSGGMMVYLCIPNLINNTITNNTGGGVYVAENANPTLVNCIIWDNEDQLSHNVYLWGPTDDPNFTYCDVKGGLEAFGGNGAGSSYTGIYENNIDADPLYVDPENGDFHLTEDSPCIDAGDPSMSYDPDGTIRDIGAYYYNPQTGVDDPEASAHVLNAFPNPFSNNVVFTFDTGGKCIVILELYSLNGQLLSTLLNEVISSGHHEFIYDASTLPEGVYFGVLKIDGGIETTKLIKM